MKSFILGLAALLVATNTFAGEITAAAQPVIHDKTGFFVHLDVDKVISSTDTYGQCGIVPARLDYLDHQGKEHVLDYDVFGQGCPSDN